MTPNAPARKTKSKRTVEHRETTCAQKKKRGGQPPGAQPPTARTCILNLALILLVPLERPPLFLWDDLDERADNEEHQPDVLLPIRVGKYSRARTVVREVVCEDERVEDVERVVVDADDES
jgi:hypothetical protein